MPILSGVSGNALASLLSLTTFGAWSDASGHFDFHGDGDSSFWGDDNGEIPARLADGVLTLGSGELVCDKVHGCVGGTVTFDASGLASEGEVAVYQGGALGFTEVTGLDIQVEALEFSDVSGLGTEIVYAVYGDGGALAELFADAPGAVCAVVSPRDSASGQGEARHSIRSPRDSASGQATGKRRLRARIDADGYAVDATTVGSVPALSSADRVVACAAWDGAALAAGAVFAYRGDGDGRISGFAETFALGE